MRHALSATSELNSMVLTDILARHAAEAAFLWHLRDASVRSPVYDLQALCRLDDRIDAHLDGLQIAGNAGWEICRAALAEPGNGEVFAATVIAIGRADVSALAEVLARGVRSRSLARGVVSALGWAPLVQVRRFLDELLANDAPPELYYLGIAGSAVHRHDPGASLVDAAGASDPRLRARALRSIGELGRVDLLPELRRELRSDSDEACMFWAAWSAALFGEPDAKEALWHLARGESSFADRAARMAMRRVELAVGCARVRELAETPAKLRVALASAAALGDPALSSWVIDCMVIPEHARFAGWAFAMITGCDLVAQKLHERSPEGFRAGPTDDPKDSNVTPDPDARLPWPNVAAVQAWFRLRGSELHSGTRHLLGKPMEPGWLEQVLRFGPQPAREAAAIELSLRKPGRSLYEVRAPGFRQARTLPES